jgi:hypothetical protein
MSKTDRAAVAHVIGTRQRAAFERCGDMAAGTTLKEIARVLQVSTSTVARHLNQARRIWRIGERARAGVQLGGRQELEYWIVNNGHLWTSPGERPTPTLVGTADRVGAA